MAAVGATHEEAGVPRPGFIWRYVFSQDHKIIGIQYLVTAMLMAVFGGALSILMRLQLAWPTTPRPWLAALLPDAYPGGIMLPEFYLSVQTMHGTIMAIFVLTAVFTGGFGNFLIPLHLGARDMAFPLLNMLSYWVYALSSLTIVLAFFVEGGAPLSGWTAYAPLSALPEAGPGQGLGQTIWLVAILLFSIATIMGTLNFLTTILVERAPGMSLGRMPLTVWGLFTSALIALFAFPVLLAAALLLMADRTLGSSFFVPGGLMLGEVAVEHSGGHPLLWQHLFWFFGHPEVYIVIVPAFGIAAELIATFIRRPVFGYRVQVLCLLAIAALSMLVWGHHMFISGMSPFAGSVFALGTLLITVPSAVLLLCWIASLWGARIQFTTPMLFGLGFISIFLGGGLGGFFLGTPWTDMQLHDTFFVVGHFHLTMAIAPLMAIFGGVYYWFPRFFGRMMHETLGQIHFWITLAGAQAVFLVMHLMGVAGFIRHSYDHTSYAMLAPYQDLNVFVTLAAFVLAGGQLLFLGNFGWSLLKGPRAPANPWGANTLEWQAPARIPHGNWGPARPTVFRGPYVYGAAGPDGPDHAPQNAPPIDQ